MYILIFVAIASFLSVNAQNYIPMYQPELENVDLNRYLSNKQLFNLEVQCLLYDGPCDIVGRYLKPRIAKGLVGECPLCTPKQAATLAKLLVWIQTNRPDLYRLAIAKYLKNSGISLPPNELATLQKLEENERFLATIQTTTQINSNI